VHVAPAGVFVASTVAAGGGALTAAVTVRTIVRNDSDSDADLRLSSVVADASGKSVARGERDLRVAAGEATEVR